MHFSLSCSTLAIFTLTALCLAQEPATKPGDAPADAAAKVEAPAYKWSAPAQEALDASKKDELDKAFSIAAKAAANKDPDCLLLAGRMYENGLGTKKDEAMAVEYYRSAAELGQLEAKSNWARCLEFGVGTKADPAKADFLWQQAAEAGFSAAQNRLGVLEVEAIRRPRNDTAAREWFEKAAAQNEPEALYRLSLCYQNGWGGLSKDLTKALGFTLRAANGGHLDAVNQVGMFYQHGVGLRQDKVAAAGWFNFAADYDHPAALANLGQCYEHGQGVKPNMETAAKLYAAAAKRNDAVGCLYLAQCFADGRGVPKNPVFAWVNFSRAVNLGLSAAEKLRDEARQKLNPAQLKEAEALLADVTAGKVKPEAAAPGKPAGK